MKKHHGKVYKHKYKTMGNSQIYYIIGDESNNIAKKRMEVFLKVKKGWNYVPPHSYYLVLKVDMDVEMRNLNRGCMNNLYDDSDLENWMLMCNA